MLKRFDFDYNSGDASVSFLVDTDKFTDEMATSLLEFFSWDYDEEEPPVDEYMKKLALQCIREGFIGNWNELGVIDEFENLEGFPHLDGSNGIWLFEIDNLDLDCGELDSKDEELSTDKFNLLLENLEKYENNLRSN